MTENEVTNWLVFGGNSPLPLWPDTSGTTHYIYSCGVCTPEHHVYPQTYAGDPQYANEFFSHCLCGKKRKVTTVEEVDVEPPKRKP